MVEGYEQLQVWERSHALALHVYKLTRDFPKSEQYGLTSQLRRAVTAIPTDIAEGSARASRKEYLQFCYIARGSLAETRYLLRLAHDLSYLSTSDYESALQACDNIVRMLNGLMRFLGKVRRMKTAL